MTTGRKHVNGRLSRHLGAASDARDPIAPDTVTLRTRLSQCHSSPNRDRKGKQHAEHCNETGRIESEPDKSERAQGKIDARYDSGGQAFAQSGSHARQVSSRKQDSPNAGDHQD